VKYFTPFLLLLTKCFGEKTSLRKNNPRSAVEEVTDTCIKCTRINCPETYNPLICDNCEYKNLCEAVCAEFSPNEDCEYVLDDPYTRNDNLEILVQEKEPEFVSRNSSVVKTAFAGDKYAKRIAFDAKAKMNILIEGMKISITKDGNLKLYVKQGSYLHYEKDRGAWEEIDVELNFNGANEFSDVIFANGPIAISAGELDAFLLTLNSGIAVASPSLTGIPGLANKVSEHNDFIDIYEGLASETNFNARTYNASMSGAFMVVEETCSVCDDQFCTEEFLPLICGSNVCRYDNGCHAACAGYNISTECTYDISLEPRTSSEGVCPEAICEASTICNKSNFPLTCSGIQSSGRSCPYSNHCEATCAGFSQSDCEATIVVIPGEECFDDSLSCEECLGSNCAWAGTCLPSCDIIADVSCYYDTLQTLRSSVDICADVARDKADHQLCASQSAENGCAACTETSKSNDEPCVWIEMFDGDHFCASEGGWIGSGVTECVEKNVLSEESCPICNQFCLAVYEPVQCSTNLANKCSYSSPCEAICAGFSNDVNTLSDLCVSTETRSVSDP